MIDEKIEIEKVNIWKVLYDEPDHSVVIDDVVYRASVGELPDTNKCGAYNDRIMPEKVRCIGYLGIFPLFIDRKLPSGEISHVVINERYKERHLFEEFKLQKMGMLSEEYCKAYYPSECDPMIVVDNIEEKLADLFKEVA